MFKWCTNSKLHVTKLICMYNIYFQERIRFKKARFAFFFLFCVRLDGVLFIVLQFWVGERSEGSTHPVYNHSVALSHRQISRYANPVLHGAKEISHTTIRLWFDRIPGIEPGTCTSHTKDLRSTTVAPRPVHKRAHTYSTDFK